MFIKTQLHVLEQEQVYMILYETSLHSELPRIPQQFQNIPIGVYEHEGIPKFVLFDI